MMHLKLKLKMGLLFLAFSSAGAGGAAPVIDPIGNVNVPAGKSLTIPITASSANGRALIFRATSTTNHLKVEVHTNNPFWKMSVVQVAPANAPGAFFVPFRGAMASVTNIGDMTFMLLKDRAPHAVDVIQGLTAGGLYTTNTILHRVVATPFAIIQGGDPGTNGQGGPVARSDNEIHPRSLFSGNGQLAMANSGKDTDGSQFFVTLGPQRGFDFRYTIFGQLVRGFSVLTNLINTQTDTNSRPLADLIISRATTVPDYFDTVLTLTATNLAGVTATIAVIADDGADGMATNSFIATTSSDTNNNVQPFLYPVTTVTNLVAPINGRLTNYFTALDLDGNTYFWFPQFKDQASFNSVTNSSYDILPDGNLVVFIVPNLNFVGSVKFYAIVSSSSLWNSFPSFFPYDLQEYTFVFGDTVISAVPTHFSAPPLVAFTNQLLATFTNGVLNSAASNFTALINWGDNSTNSAIITTNAAGQKEVRGAHTYTNPGSYPVYVTIRSTIGAEATVVATAIVPPVLILTHSGANNILNWPGWAADFTLQSQTDLSPANWLNVTNTPALIGYDLVVTNDSAGSRQFFRLNLVE